MTRIGRELGTVREEAVTAAVDATRQAHERLAGVDATFTLMRADLGASREQLEALEGGVERLSEQLTAGRAESEATSAQVLGELAAVREVAELAGRRCRRAARDDRGDARGDRRRKIQAELANAVAEKARATAEQAKLEDEKVEALQAEVQFAISTMQEMKEGLASAGQAALVARRDAEQARRPPSTPRTAASTSAPCSGRSLGWPPRAVRGPAGRPSRTAVPEPRSRATASTTRPRRWP